MADTAPKVETLAPTIRHRKRGFFKLKQDCWGARYEKAPDPEGSEDDVPDDLWIPDDFSRLPSEQWARVVQLYIELCDPNNRVVDARSEVSVVFARRAPDFREWRTFVPKQTVGAGSVDADLTKLCDIVTGEELDGFPEGWCHAGSSHSHHTMGAFFSGTDDRNELSVPGMHVVVGEITKSKRDRWRYMPKASIVLNHQRRIVDYHQVIDVSPIYHEPHPKVKDYIKKYSYSSYGSPDFQSYSDMWCTKHSKQFRACSCTLPEFKARLEAEKKADEAADAPTPPRGTALTTTISDTPSDGTVTPDYLRAYPAKRDQEEAEKREAEKRHQQEFLAAEDDAPQFQQEIDAATRKAAMDGDQGAIMVRLAVLEARQAAKNLANKEAARTIHRLCDAVQAARLDKGTREVLWKLMLEACDDAEPAEV